MQKEIIYCNGTHFGENRDNLVVLALSLNVAYRNCGYRGTAKTSTLRVARVRCAIAPTTRFKTHHRYEDDQWKPLNLDQHAHFLIWAMVCK